jgi:hypothetical protein
LPRKEGRQQIQRFIAKRYCCTLPKKATRFFTDKISKLLKALIATPQFSLIKLFYRESPIKNKQSKGKFHLNTCPLPSLTDILVHYLLLLRKSFQPFKTVKITKTGSKE